MGISIGFGVGPVRVSHRLRAPRLPRRPASSAPVSRGPVTPRSAMTSEQLRTAFRVDWVWVLGGSLFALATPYTAALIPVGVVLVVLSHRRTLARRATPTTAGGAPPRGPVCPVTEARRAEALGLTESARMWRAEGARMVAEAPTVQLPAVR